MSTQTPQGIVDAKRQAVTARARIDTDVAALQARLHPKVLAQDALTGVREKTDQLTDTAVATARKRPAAAAAVGGVVGMVILRKPLRGLYRLLFRRHREDDDLPVGRVKLRQARRAAAAQRRDDVYASDTNQDTTSPADIRTAAGTTE